MFSRPLLHAFATPTPLCVLNTQRLSIISNLYISCNLIIILLFCVCICYTPCVVCVCPKHALEMPYPRRILFMLYFYYCYYYIPANLSVINSLLFYSKLACYLDRFQFTLRCRFISKLVFVTFFYVVVPNTHTLLINASSLSRTVRYILCCLIVYLFKVPF